jgi:hypothetical protein
VLGLLERMVVFKESGVGLFEFSSPSRLDSFKLLLLMMKFLLDDTRLGKMMEDGIKKLK